MSTAKLLKVDNDTYQEVKNLADKNGDTMAGVLRKVFGADTVEFKPDRAEEIAAGLIHNSAEIDKIEAWMKLANEDIDKLAKNGEVHKKAVLAVAADVAELKRNSDSFLKMFKTTSELLENIQSRLDDVIKGTADAFDEQYKQHEALRESYNAHIMDFHTGVNDGRG